jgi:hypothetical protein
LILLLEYNIVMKPWFKTVNNLPANKFAHCVLTPATPMASFDHLLEAELKGKIPLSIMVENPTKELKALMNPVKGKTYLSLLEWGLLAQNYTFLNWLLNKEYTLTKGDIKLFLNQLIANPIKAEAVTPDLTTFFNTLVLKLPPDSLQVAGVKASGSLPYFLINHLPSSLSGEIIKAHPPKMMDLYTMTVQSFNQVWSVHKSLFPYLAAIEEFEKKSIGFFNGLNLPIATLNALETLTKYPQLKKGVEEVLETKSKEVVKVVDTKVFPRAGNQVTMDGEYLSYLLFLKTIFCPKTNPSDFITYLDQKKLLSLTKDFTPEYQVILSQLLNLFTNSQKKVLLNSWSGKLHFREVLTLFNSYPLYYQNLIKETEFKEINTFLKLRDFLSAKANVASVELVNLHQATYFPSVMEMQTLTLPEDYSIIVAQTNHELIKWGVDMDHCIGGTNYQNDAAKGRCLLLALAKKGEPKYAVEVRNHRVVQIQGKSGRDVQNKLLLTSLYKALEHFNLIER